MRRVGEVGLGVKTTGWVVFALALGAGIPARGQTAATTPAVKPTVLVVARTKTIAAKTTAKKKPGATVARTGKGKAGAVKKPVVRSTAATREAVARVLRLNSAFVASAQLRPMAQQLASTRTAAAYAGVVSYAASHPGAGAATAYLALGHAYGADHRYGDAADAYRRAGSVAGGAGDALSDYSDYLGAQALMAANRSGEVFPLLDRFAERHPESIFDATAPLLLANAFIQQKNGVAAAKVLEPMLGTPEAEHAEFKFALGRAYQVGGDNAKAAAQYRSVFIGQPLAYEATQSLTQLTGMGMTPSAAERKVRADQLFNAKRYNDASAEYSAIRNDRSLMPADRDALEIYSAVCDLKLKKLGRHEAEKLPATSDDSAALKLYLLAEISRTEKDRAGHDAIIAQMAEKYPNSRWLEEALYSGGNMYLLTHDTDQAIYHYQMLVDRFPMSIYAPSAHWRVAWMEYRLRRYTDAARLMDEQVVRYGAGLEAPAALYWRGRIYEDQAQDFAQAANYYRILNTTYTNYYYGYLARQRLAVLGHQPDVVPAAALASVRKFTVPDLVGTVPQDDPHVIKAKLLANAALNEYIGPEISVSAGAAQWGALAQAEIYASYGEYSRSLQALKRSGISFFALPPSKLPQEYLRLMFPQPWWSDLVADAGRNGLDPYLVASLVRQESEFNPGAVSPAHAYGLMQLLASVGKENAKREGLKGFQTAQLLNPATNLQLGTRNLKLVMDRFSGQPEYALAAYNAGDVPVRQWMANGDYKDIAEFVESIPYTETREYVQAIMRNREMYRALYSGK
jgi:soluble lytic murein transglycosylase